MRGIPNGQWPLWRDYKQVISGRFGKQPFADSLAELQLRQHLFNGIKTHLMLSIK